MILMMSEVMLGRYSKKRPVDALSLISSKFHGSKYWGIIGYIGIIGLVIILSFYSLVSGWCMAYVPRTLSGSFTNATATDVSSLLGGMLSSPLEMILWLSGFLVLTLVVVAKDIKNGLESAIRYLMPMMFILLFIIVSYALFAGDAEQAVQFLFAFKPGDITGTVVLSAMGHAFFTLALGAGAIMTYGRHVGEEVNLPSTILIIAALDTAISIVVGLAIFPMVLLKVLIQPVVQP